MAGRFRIALSSLLLLSFSVSLSARKSQPPPPKPAPVLPATLDVWQRSSDQTSADASAADAMNPAVLKEYGFTSFESATYKTDDGRTLSVKAIQFGDASGAYGAFTFYRKPQSRDEEIGSGAAFDGSHVVFWSGSTLVDAVFSELTAMSASELRDLSEVLPKLSGNTSIPPSLPKYFPKAGLDPQTVRYALGSIGYVRSGGILPAEMVGFEQGAETATAQYSTTAGDGSLTIVNYPTPQIAAERQRQIEAFLKQPQGSWPQALSDSRPDSLKVRRSGPFVTVSAGDFSAEMAQRLTSAVHYDADVTMNNPKGYISEDTKTARLVLGIFSLIGVMLGATIVLGIFFGGGRALIRRLRGKPASTVPEAEFISLHLD